MNAIAAPLPFSVLQRGSNYDERRVQRLQRALDLASQHLARGVPPPVQGTAVFPPGKEGSSGQWVWQCHHLMKPLRQAG